MPFSPLPGVGFLPKLVFENLESWSQIARLVASTSVMMIKGSVVLDVDNSKAFIHSGVLFFGGRVLGAFRSSNSWSSKKGVPDFGAPDFGAPGFGLPKFGVPSFGMPQIRSSNFSTHEFDCLGGRHYKNNNFGISEFRSFGLLSRFRSCASRIFGAPDLRFSEFQISELQISELQISELQISEFQISELQLSELQISELLISEFLISEFLSSELLVLEFLRSGAPTSQLTSLIVQEAVELADTTKTVVRNS